MSEAAFPPVALGPLLPTLIVLGAAGLVLLVDLLPRRGGRDHLAALALVGVVAALLAVIWRAAASGWAGAGRAFLDMIVLDGFAMFATIVICYAAALVILLSVDYLRRTGAESGEYYALVLFATAGMMLLAIAADLPIVGEPFPDRWWVRHGGGAVTERVLEERFNVSLQEGSQLGCPREMTRRVQPGATRVPFSEKFA